MEMPIYATCYTPSGPFKEGPDEVNVPIARGGIPMMSGDIIIGDGVIVIPKVAAEKVLEEAKIVLQKDTAKVQAAKNGTLNKS